MSSAMASLVGKVVVIVLFGVLIRYCLLKSSYQKDISERVEITTPVNSWKRSSEGVFLWNKGIAPYAGDLFHEPPIFLYIYDCIQTKWSDYSSLIFIMADVVTGIVLGVTSFIQLKDIHSSEKPRLQKLKNKEDAKELELNEEQFSDLSLLVTTIYLLSPYSVLACVACSTSVFQNMLISLLMLTATLKIRHTSSFLVALIAYHSLYPVMLIVPIIMMLECPNLKFTSTLNEYYLSKRTSVSIFYTLTLILLTIVTLLYISHNLVDGNLAFLHSTYTFLLTVVDLRPNVGLFWYFFTEMFDHFRTFFLWTFQINVFLYVVPLALTLRKEPRFLLFVLLILLSLFKSYPSISDFAIYLALLPQWNHLFKYTKQGLLISCVIVTCSVLAPIMWHSWIILGTANSNYYFGVTLAYNTAQILLITDLLFAFTKRQFYIEKGIVREKNDELNSKPARLELVF